MSVSAAKLVDHATHTGTRGSIQNYSVSSWPTNGLNKLECLYMENFSSFVKRDTLANCTHS
jgi:hypothetical protein